MHHKTILSEINYKAVRSSGAGGQHVNKVSTKVLLSFNLIESNAFSITEKERLVSFFSNKLTQDGLLLLSASETSSQFKNKKIVTQKLLDLLAEGLKVDKPRKKSKPSRASVLRGKAKKKNLSDKKALRKKPRLE